MAESNSTNRTVEIVLVIMSSRVEIKFRLFRMAKESRTLAHGMVTKIGEAAGEVFYARYNGIELRKKIPIDSHLAAMEQICEMMVDPRAGVISSLDEVDAVGHRVVHGGDKIHSATRITEDVKHIIEEYTFLAPLHNPANLLGIAACEKLLPNAPAVAVFDTAFHHSMPPSSYLYAIPYENYEKHGIRKYGFHGQSHQYAMNRTAEFLDRKVADLKLITCHLGKGCSVTAIDSGRVLDTSMGMTPMPGLVMGSRCGDLDPAVVLYLMNQGMSIDEIQWLLNKESGLLGVAGLGSSHMEDVESATRKNNEQASRAVWMFVHRLVSYIGAYYTLLNGADAIVFTGGIGENSTYIRSRVVGQLGVLGCRLNEPANNAKGRLAMISDKASSLKAIVVVANEKLMIAKETKRLLSE